MTITKKSFLDTLHEDGILADGGIGTELYRHGIFINRCYDELNLSQPKLISSIHESYINAGSQFIETNTFMANHYALRAHGYESKMEDINVAGVQLAKQAAADKAFVAGSVGPIAWTMADQGGLNDDELHDAFAEHIRLLADTNVDVILLETFTNIQELHMAFQAAKSVTDIPIITQVSLKYLGEDHFEGLLPEDAARTMSNWGADVVGINCCEGPQGVFEAAKRMKAVTDTPISAMPNAGLPKMIQGRTHYLASPEYMAEYAKRYVQIGVSLIGGCCGTTPDHIREMHHFLHATKHLKTSVAVNIISQTDPVEKKEPIVQPEKSDFAKHLHSKFNVCVEVDPPLGISMQKALDGAKLLADLGVDAVNIADGPRAMARMSPIPLAIEIKRQIGIEPIVHYCCRDRNLLGMQMDLIGASALELNNILIITGDPPKMGHYPNATAVFDVDAIGLIRFVANMNHGLDFANRPINGQTRFLIGCGVNPGAVDIDLEVERYKQKITMGAEFAFSQPIYDPNLLSQFSSKIQGIKKIPLFVGILPLVSLRNAEFLHNEVPGMQIPASIMQRIATAKSKEAQQSVGCEIAKDALSEAKDLSGIDGAYIFPPFGKYHLIKELMTVLK